MASPAERPRERERPLVLVADHRDTSRVALSKALRSAGLDVQTARDGSRALEISVLDRPDVVVFEASNPLIDGRRFIEIIRSNPKTEGTPLVITGDDPNLVSDAGLRVSFVRWPYDVEDVVAMLTDLLGRAAAAKEVSTADTKVEGSLGEIGLIDLLQIFVMNRKEGVLRLDSPDGHGEVHLRDGSVWHARLGPTQGIKALYRFLGWRTGRFHYVPERVEAARTIKGSADQVIMEGTRQADEIERMGEDRPARSARVGLLIDRSLLPEGLHRVTQEVVELLEFYDRVGDVLDHSTHTDFEVYRALLLLQDKGIVHIGEPDSELEGPHEALIQPEQLARLFGRGRALLGTGMSSIWKVVVLARSKRALSRFLGPFGRIAGFEADATFFAESGGEEPPIGTAARLPLADRHELLFVACPTDEIFRPLLGLFTDRALAVLVVDWTGAEALAALVREGLSMEALPVDLDTFAPEGVRSDGGPARALIQDLVALALGDRATG